MDLSDPTRAVMPSLDGPVLAVLAASGRPLTVGEVALQASRGSEIGIRRTLSRLGEQGLVKATMIGRNLVHELNRDHVAARIAEGLAGLRLELWDRIRRHVASWGVAPVYACAFGSAARGDGNAASDIDILLVHPIFPGDPPRSSAMGRRRGSPTADEWALLETSDPRTDPEHWDEQADRLRERIVSWTGNHAQIVDLAVAQWLQTRGPHRALREEIERDAVDLFNPHRLPETMRHF